MIPYFQFITFHLGPIPIQVWGTFVVIGILVGGWFATKLAKERGQSTETIWNLVFWSLLGAMIGARLFHVFFYRPEYFFSHPIEIFYLWEGGEAVTGGLIGAVFAGVLYLKKKKLDIFRYADTAIFGLPVGYAIGRIGCFLIHEHPGTVTDFFLGVKYPDGFVRHDLGLYEAISGFILTMIVWILHRRKVPVGVYTIIFLLWYGITRFFFDFLRAYDGPIVDARYAGLTPAQYVAVPMVLLGIWLWITRFRKSLSA